jgi:hypothetical protein
MVCQSGICRCSNTDTHFFDFKSLACSQKTFNNTSCLSNRTCRSDLGLSCQNGLCQCLSPKFWHAGQCSYPLGYSQIGCTSDSHCESALGLVCNGYPTANTSSCSITAVPSMCDCPQNKYWNNSQCVPQLNDNQNCSNSCQCLSSSICDSCISVCLSNANCEMGWTYFNGKCYIRVGRTNYNNAVANCSSLLPSKSSQIAILNDEITVDYLICAFSTSNGRAFISDASTISCSGNDNCKTLRNNRCETRQCNQDRFAICESLV